jgi:nucleoside-diphosphate-sugar epimerase
MKTIAITGSSGFIGKHLVKKLKELQYNTIELDITNNIDVTDWSQVQKIPHFDVIIHLAAKSFVPDSFINPHEFYSVNQNSTLNVLELARIHSSKVIYFSSYLYGEPQYLPIDEKHPLKPHNPYAQSKIICEKICEGYHRDFNVPIIIFRPFNIYGPGQNELFLLPKIIKQQKTGHINLIDPRPKRDFIHVFDIISAVITAIEYNNSDLLIFNLGTGKSFSVEEIVSLIVKNSGFDVSVNYSNEYRAGEVLDTVADIKKIYNVLNWLPSVEIEQGLKLIK